MDGIADFRLAQGAAFVILPVFTCRLYMLDNGYTKFELEPFDSSPSKI